MGSHEIEGDPASAGKKNRPAGALGLPPGDWELRCKCVIYLTGAVVVAAAAGVVFLAFLLCFLVLAVFVAGADGSVFGASAANIIGTATAVANRVMAIFFILILLRSSY